MLRNKRKVDFGGRVVYQDDSLFELTQSNITLMSKGKAPFGWDGQRVNLHHLSGKEPGPMLEISASLHHIKNYMAIYIFLLVMVSLLGRTKN